MAQQQAKNSLIYRRIYIKYTFHGPKEQIEGSVKNEILMMMLNLSYLTATNAKNQLLCRIQSISAVSVHSYGTAFNKRTLYFIKTNIDCTMAL